MKQRPLSTSSRALGLAFTLALVACERESPAPPASPSATGIVATQIGSAAEASPNDAEWARALESEDDADLATLAQREGAVRLAGALAEPSKASVARRALVFSHDPDEAFIVIAERIAKSTSVEADVELLLRLTERGQRFGERLDPEADARVLEVLEDSADKQADAKLRGKLQSLISRLRERGLAR